jgi:hypothetical protein
MTVIRTSVIALTAAVVVALLTGCASNKGPAEAALAAAQSAVDSVMAEASKYVPDQAQSLQSQLTALKDKFGKGEYEAVVTTWGGRERPPADPRGVSDECRQWWPFYVAYPLFGPGSRRALID